MARRLTWRKVSAMRRGSRRNRNCSANCGFLPPDTARQLSRQNSRSERISSIRSHASDPARESLESHRCLGGGNLGSGFLFSGTRSVSYRLELTCRVRVRCAGSAWLRVLGSVRLYRTELVWLGSEM
eukprot:3117928-Rhodomonas_salina.2